MGVETETPSFASVRDTLRRSPKRWLVTGAAGFIGSHLVEELLRLGQSVTGLDNLSTGFLSNLDEVKAAVGEEAWRGFRWIKGDICDPAAVSDALRDVEIVLHQAALGSVPRSIEDPLGTNEANVTGFVRILKAAADAKVKRFVYASSSSVYGDITDKVKTESRMGNPLSPYAASKHADELYARSASSAYGISTVGLRYFNVFGPRQNPNGPYAAVVPRWLDALKKGERCVIFGDGETTRDFCYVDNVVEANILAGVCEKELKGEAFNIAVGETTSLKTLFALLCESLGVKSEPEYKPFRNGDVRHSLADITAARKQLGYDPKFRFADGVRALAAYSSAATSSAGKE